MQRRRQGSRGRFPIQPKIEGSPRSKRMEPQPLGLKEPIYMDLAETEVLRLVDLEGLDQEEAGRSMGISRGTVWRLLSSARKKTIQALYEARPLVVGEAPPT